MRSILSTLVELLGLAAFAFGTWTFDWRAGVVITGAILVLIGVAVDGPVKSGPSR